MNSGSGCFLFFILGVIAVPALITAILAKGKVSRLQAVVESLSTQIAHLESRLMELRRDVRRGATAAPAEPTIVEERPAPAAEPVSRAAMIERPTERPIVRPIDRPDEPPIEAHPVADGADHAPQARPIPNFPPRPTVRVDWENLIGVRLFAWLGGITLFIGAALFLQYSVQHNLISPAARIAIALMAGAAAVLGGDFLRRKADRAGQALSGAGVGILYAALFAAHARFHLMGANAAFAALAFVTVVAGAMALKRHAYMLAVIGMIGGFMTPYLLSTGQDRSLALFCYIALLDAGVAALARRRDWPSLSLLGVLGSSVIFIGWAARFLDAGKIEWALLAAAALGALFVFTQPWKRIEGEKRILSGMVATLAIAGPLLVAMVESGEVALEVSPYFLVPYLLLLIGGACFLAGQIEFPFLIPGAAVLTTLTLMLRVRRDLFPAHRSGTLILFAIPALFLFGLWVAMRKSPRAKQFRMAAVIALVGSLLTVSSVVMMEPKSEPIVAVLLFALVNAVSLIAMGALTRSGEWPLIAQAYSLAVLLAVNTRFTGARLSEFVPGILISAMVFWALPFLHDVFRRDRLSWISSAAAPVLHFPILYVLAKKSWGYGPLGAISIVCGILGIVALRRALSLLRADREETRFTTALFGAVTLLFATAAIPILLEKQWITVAWALEAAALAWLYVRVRYEQVMFASGVIASFAFLRLIANEALWRYHPRSGVPVFNWYLYTFGIPAIAFLVASRWAKASPEGERMRYPAMLKTAAGVLLFMLLNVEIADYYSIGQTLAFRFSGAGVAEDMTYSLAWALFAIGLLVTGILLKEKPARAAALLVLAFAIGKVFLHDLWNLGALYRVASIIGLAISLLAVSFLMQRFILVKDPA